MYATVHWKPKIWRRRYPTSKKTWKGWNKFHSQIRQTQESFPFDFGTGLCNSIIPVTSKADVTFDKYIWECVCVVMNMPFPTPITSIFRRPCPLPLRTPSPVRSLMYTEDQIGKQFLGNLLLSDITCGYTFDTFRLTSSWVMENCCTTCYSTRHNVLCTYQSVLYFQIDIFENLCLHRSIWLMRKSRRTTITLAFL